VSRTPSPSFAEKQMIRNLVPSLSLALVMAVVPAPLWVGTLLWALLR
jgi:hypothetical protein